MTEGLKPTRSINIKCIQYDVCKNLGSEKEYPKFKSDLGTSPFSLKKPG